MRRARSLLKKRSCHHARPILKQSMSSPIHRVRPLLQRSKSLFSAVHENRLKPMRHLRKALRKRERLARIEKKSPHDAGLVMVKPVLFSTDVEICYWIFAFLRS